MTLTHHGGMDIEELPKEQVALLVTDQIDVKAFDAVSSTRHLADPLRAGGTTGGPCDPEIPAITPGLRAAATDREL